MLQKMQQRKSESSLGWFAVPECMHLFAAVHDFAWISSNQIGLFQFPRVAAILTVWQIERLTDWLTGPWLADPVGLPFVFVLAPPIMFTHKIFIWFAFSIWNLPFFPGAVLSRGFHLGAWDDGGGLSKGHPLQQHNNDFATSSILCQSSPARPPPPGLSPLVVCGSTCSIVHRLCYRLHHLLRHRFWAMALSWPYPFGQSPVCWGAPSSLPWLPHPFRSLFGLRSS